MEDEGSGGAGGSYAVAATLHSQHHLALGNRSRRKGPQAAPKSAGYVRVEEVLIPPGL
jgi:hypothetical protein